jgi:hypothetical protein
MGTMPFTRTLENWAKFEIDNRTMYDAAISSGLAIMACNKHLYTPSMPYERPKAELGFKKYNNSGLSSQIIQ